MPEDMAAWQRLAERLVARRTELGYGPKSREAFARDKGFPNSRVISDMENARRTNYDPGSYAQMEQAYQWQTGSIKAVLAGGEPRESVPADRPVDRAAVTPSADAASYVADVGPDAHPPGITDEELLGMIQRQRRELDEIERRLRERGSVG